MERDEEIRKFASVAPGLVGQIGMQAAQQYDRTSCAHLMVGYVRQALGGGRERGWWQCVECDQKFVLAIARPANL